MGLKIVKHTKAQSFEDLCYEYHAPECEDDWHGFELAVCGHKGEIILEVNKLRGYYGDETFMEFIKLRHLSLSQLNQLVGAMEEQLKNYSDFISKMVAKQYIGCELHSYCELYDAYYELKAHLMGYAQNKDRFLENFKFFAKEEE